MTNTLRKPSVSNFHSACSNGNISDVISLLDADSTFLTASSFEDEGNTALHYACAAGHLDIVKCLLKRGAPLNKPNDLGWTPLMQACYAGHSEVVAALIQAQADVNIVNNLNCTALTLGCYNGNEKIVRSLIESGAQFMPNNGGEVGSSSSREAYFNPMIAACVRGNIDALKELMNAFHSVALSMKDSYNGETPLSLSAVFNWTQLVEVLLKEGADADSVDVNNRTALDLATLCKSRQCKAILKAKTEKRSAALSVDIHPVEHPIIEMAKQGNLKNMRELLDTEASLINSRNTEDGATVLMYACVAGHLSVVKLLVSKGANLDEQDFLSGWTALMQATYHNNSEIVKFLIESGADVTIKSFQGINAFDIASLMDNVDSDITPLLASQLKNANLAAAVPNSSTEEHLSSVSLMDKFSATSRTSSTPVLNRLRLGEDDVTNSNLRSGSGAVKSLWSRFTGKFKDIKLGRPDINKVSVMSHEDMDQVGMGPGPRYGGWISINDRLNTTDVQFSPDEAFDSGIFSTPSMYSIQIEPNHVQATKQLAPVVPPFCAVPSGMEFSNNVQLSRHKSSFTRRTNRSSSGYKHQHKPIKSNPPKFLQPKKSSQNSSVSSVSGGVQNTVPKFEASEHSNHISPQSSGDYSRKQNFLASRPFPQSRTNFGMSQHVASPVQALSTNGGQTGSSSGHNRLQPSLDNDQKTSKGSGLGHNRIGSFGSSFSSGDYNSSLNSNHLFKPPAKTSDASLGNSPAPVVRNAIGSGLWSSPRGSTSQMDEDGLSGRLLSPGRKTSSSEMAQILSELALMKYKHIFDQQEVDTEVLLGLTEEDLDEMGIQQRTSKEHILSAISAYNRTSHSNNNNDVSTSVNKSNHSKQTHLSVTNQSVTHRRTGTASKN